MKCTDLTDEEFLDYFEAHIGEWDDAVFDRIEAIYGYKVNRSTPRRHELVRFVRDWIVDRALDRLIGNHDQ